MSSHPIQQKEVLYLPLARSHAWLHRHSPGIVPASSRLPGKLADSCLREAYSGLTEYFGGLTPLPLFSGLLSTDVHSDC